MKYDAKVARRCHSYHLGGNDDDGDGDVQRKENMQHVGTSCDEEMEIEY